MLYKYHWGIGIVITILFFILPTSFRSNLPPLLPEKTKALLIDLHICEVLAESDDDNLPPFSQQINMLCAHHETTHQALQNLLLYYLDHPEAMLLLYQEILLELSDMKKNIQRKEDQ